MKKSPFHNHSKEFMKPILSILKSLCTFTSSFKNKKLSILIYHRVLNEYDFMNPWEVDKSIFDWQMALFAKYFNVLSLSEALERLENNTLPSRAVCITFDDGYADNYLNALPILLKYNLNATFFVASGFLDGGRMWNDTITETIRNLKQSKLDLTQLGYGVFDIQTTEYKMTAASKIIAKVKHLSPSERESHVAYIAEHCDGLPDNLMMTTQQLIQLSESKMEIGGHTVTHPILASLDIDNANNEIAENKHILETKLGKKIRYFAYPNGKPKKDYLPEHVEIVKNNGYEAAVSTSWGVSNKNSDKWQLARATPWDRTPEKFMLRMAKIFTQ
jgi:peptidoglycan/xylan/chitin deacetylase (PgdA/CDA1 family)